MTSSSYKPRREMISRRGIENKEWAWVELVGSNARTLLIESRCRAGRGSGQVAGNSHTYRTSVPASFPKMSGSALRNCSSPAECLAAVYPRA